MTAQDEVVLTDVELDWVVWCVQNVLQNVRHTLSEEDVEAVYNKLENFRFQDEERNIVQYVLRKEIADDTASKK